MSADNYFYIAKRRARWLGVELIASLDYTDEELEQELYHPRFRTTSLVKAIKLAQEEYTEYGYTIEDKSLDAA